MNRTDPIVNASQAIRGRIRSGEITGHTSGPAPGGVQGNVVIMPAALSSNFLRFCQANPKPCPLLAVSEPGDPAQPVKESVGGGVIGAGVVGPDRFYEQGRPETWTLWSA